MFPFSDDVCSSDQHKNKCHLCSTYEVYFSPQKLRRRCRGGESLAETSRRYPKMCSTCKSHVKKYHLNGSDFGNSDVPHCNQCRCLRKEDLSSFAQQLHKKLSETLDGKSNLFHKCIDCGDVVG